MLETGCYSHFNKGGFLRVDQNFFKQGGCNLRYVISLKMSVGLFYEGGLVVDW